MDSQVCKYITTEDNGMEITLEFPCNSQDGFITPEAKSILAAMLNEYIEKVLKM